VYDVVETFTHDVIDAHPTMRALQLQQKLAAMLRRGELLGCDRIASAHHVRAEHAPAGSGLLRGLDRQKDQAYFLWALPWASLPGLEFALDELTKP
jgi:tRNA-specific 2-thiouridylase